MVLRKWESRSSPIFFSLLSPGFLSGLFYLYLSGMKILSILFISIFFLNPTGYCSSVKDTITIHARVKAYKFDADNTSLDSMGIDTALTRIEIYNPPFRDGALEGFLGNLGDPYQSVIYSQRTAYPDFLFSNYVNYDLHKPENTVYYKAWTPYTELSYFTGGPKSRQEQKLNVIHTQNINKSVNVSFLGDFNYSDGQYINQLMKSHAYSLSSSYQGKRYSIFGSINYNLLLHHENGGIYNDTIDPKQKAEVVPVNLNYAVSTVRNQNISFQQRFYLTGSYKSDSLHENSKWNEVVSIIHQFHYDRNSRSYVDQLQTAHTDIPSLIDQNYYHHLNIDSTKTNDSAYFRRIENIFQLAINTNQWLNVPAELRFGIKNQIDKYSYSVPKYADSTNSVLGNYGRYGKTYINNSFIGSLTNKFSKTIRWGAFAEYYFSDYKANDLEFGGDIEKSIWGNFILKVSDHFSSTRPGYFLQDYESNHIQWHNSFSTVKQQVNSLHGGLYLKKFKFSIEAQYDNLNNFIYFDTAALPKKAGNKFSVSSLTVNKLIDWGIFHTNFRLTLQRSGDTAALPLPLFSGFNSTYIEVNLFKKVLKFQLGFDVFYNSVFYANAYMPVTGMFYSQHKQLIGNYNYPFTNVFLNIKVKRLCFFLEYEQINSLDQSQRGFFLPQYPYNPGILKYGLSWKFYD